MSKSSLIIHIGPYSIIGGVSVHIRRLTDGLSSDYEFAFIDESKAEFCINDSRVVCLRKGQFFQYLKLVFKARAVHIHTGTWWLRSAHLFLMTLLRKRTFITLHSANTLGGSKSIALTRRLLKLCRVTVICVNPIIKDKIGIEEALVKPAFLPPMQTKKLPPKILEVLEKQKGKKMVVSNAFRLILKDDTDLYGLDMCIELAEMIKEECQQIFIVFVIANADVNLDLLEAYKNRIEQKQLHQQIFLYCQSLSFPDLVKRSDVVLRLTTTDGDALTIREALYFGKTVVASNVVERPEGTVIFKSRDTRDLYEKLTENMSGNNFALKNGAEGSLEFYRNLYNELR